MVRGFIVNKFWGDPRLFDAGLDFIAERTGWAPLGLVPFFPRAVRLPAEDAFSLRGSRHGAGKRIAVPLLPHIANFDDFDPLKNEPEVELVMVAPGQPLPVCDLVILPGSKTTIADLTFFRAQGWDIDLFAHARRGGKVFGICGGYQMLGRKIADPLGIEGFPGAAPGLGLLAVETELTATKILAACSGVSADGAAFSGYEMHVGVTSGADCARPLLHFSDGGVDGAQNASGAIRGAYVHGLFASPFRAEFLLWIGAESAGLDHEAEIERILDELADHLAAHVDLDVLLSLAR
jgi:adenosylcobyric acid synthase